MKAREEMREPTPPTPSRLALVPFDRIELDRAPAYLVKGIVPREGFSVVWGPPKCGKSFWTFDLTMHVALGRPYRGRHVMPGPVVYVACEGGHGFKARVAAFRQRHIENGSEPPFFLVPARLDLVRDQKELAAEIRDALGDHTPAVIVLDTLNRSIAGSESSDEDMSAYIHAVDDLRDAFNCAVIVVHHCGTEGTRPRGHTSLTGAVDAQISVKRIADGQVVVKVEYLKDGPEGDEIFSRLEPVEVGTDEDGDAITSCVVVPVEGAAAAEQKPLTGHTKTAHEALIAVVDKRQVSSENRHQTGHLPHVPVDDWRDEFYARQIDGRDTKQDTLKKRFQRAGEELKRRGHAGFRNGQAWLCPKPGHAGT